MTIEVTEFLNGAIEVYEDPTTTTPAVEIYAPVAPGARGKSAYEVAVDNGFAGTEAQWLASLQAQPNVLILAAGASVDPATPADTAVFRYRS